MANNNEVVIAYSRLIQKSGSSINMPSLASGEIGYMEDAGRVFIGADPSITTMVDYNRVIISPFLNSRMVVQSYLDDSTDYNAFVVNQDMTVDTGSNSMAVELADFINTTHQEQYDINSTQRQVIAKIDNNIEMVTNKNINQYANPADFNVKFGPVDRINSSGDRALYQLLDSSSGDLFLEYQYQNILYINIEYMLIHNNGEHVRSGTLRVVADNTFNAVDNAVINDEHVVLIGDETNVVFSVTASGGILNVVFTQPPETQSKIFYRLSRWNIEDYVNINNYYEENYIGPLSVNDNLVLNTNNEV